MATGGERFPPPPYETVITDPRSLPQKIGWLRPEVLLPVGKALTGFLVAIGAMSFSSGQEVSVAITGLVTAMVAVLTNGVVIVHAVKSIYDHHRTLGV